MPDAIRGSTRATRYGAPRRAGSSARSGPGAVRSLRAIWKHFGMLSCGRLPSASFLADENATLIHDKNVTRVDSEAGIGPSANGERRAQRRDRRARRCGARRVALLDDLIRPQQQRGREGEAEGLGGPEVCGARVLHCAWILGRRLLSQGRGADESEGYVTTIEKLPLKRSDEALDSLVVGLERVFAEDRLAFRVVELQVDPVHAVVLALQVGLTDELAAQAGARRLRRHVFGLLDRLVVGDPVHVARRTLEVLELHLERSERAPVLERDRLSQRRVVGDVAYRLHG